MNNYNIHLFVCVIIVFEIICSSRIIGHQIEPADNDDTEI